MSHYPPKTFYVEIRKHNATNTCRTWLLDAGGMGTARSHLARLAA